MPRPPLPRANRPRPAPLLTWANILIALGLLLILSALLAAFWFPAAPPRPAAAAIAPRPAQLILQTALLTPAQSAQLQLLLQRTGVSFARLPLLPQWLNEAKVQQLRVHGLDGRWWLERRDGKGPIAVVGLGNANQHPAFAKVTAMQPDILVEATLPRTWWQQLLPETTPGLCSQWSQFQTQLPEQARWQVRQALHPTLVPTPDQSPDREATGLSWCLSWTKPAPEWDSDAVTALPPAWSGLRAGAHDRLLLQYAPARNCPAGPERSASTLLRVWQDDAATSGTDSALHQALLMPGSATESAALPAPMAGASLTGAPSAALQTVALTTRDGARWTGHASDGGAARWLRAAAKKAAPAETQPRFWLYSYLGPQAASSEASSQTSTQARTATSSAAGTELQAFSDADGLHLCVAWPVFAQQALARTGTKSTPTQ